MTIGMPRPLAAAQATSSRSSRERMGVELQQLAVLAGGLHHRVEVDLVGLSLEQHAAGRMGKARDVRIGQGAEHAAGDLLARLLLAVMDAGDHPIGLGQHVVGQVEPAALEDVDLDAFEDRDAVEPLVELVDFGPLLAGPARRPGRRPSTPASSDR